MPGNGVIRRPYLPVPSPAASCVLWRSRGRARLQGGVEWPLYDQPGRYSGSHGAFVSQSNLATSSLPSTHPSLPVLPPFPRGPAAASHLTMEPGLGGCCSESRESPIWTTGETGERCEVDGEEDSGKARCIFRQGQRRIEPEPLSMLEAVDFHCRKEKSHVMNS